MSEFRQNIASGEWVIISPERARRPADYHSKEPKPALPPYSENCPFCHGNEHKCETPVYEKTSDDKWSLRVVPNIYAAVQSKNTPERKKAGLYLHTTGYGVAEVIIESPEHNANIAFLPLEHAVEIVRAYRFRFNALYCDPNIAIVNIFKNHGASAGASLTHPHSQIIATMVSPPHTTDQIVYARRAFNTWGRCIYCDVLAEEIRVKERLVMETDHFIAFCPFASKHPYDVRIFPRRHSALFGTITPEEEKDFAFILQTVLRKMYLLLDNPDYNYYICSVPNSDGLVQYYHWYLVITPRLVQTAGFELGTRIYINPSLPETCAAELREVE
jgi:UDPglucose--hexose-1-phosphate uridylyltransferase